MGKKRGGKKCCLESAVLSDAWKSAECFADVTFEQGKSLMSMWRRLKCAKEKAHKKEGEEERAGMFCENMCVRESTLDANEWKSGKKSGVDC